MQTKSLRIQSYQSWTISDTASSAAIARLKKIELHDKLKAEGCRLEVRLEAIDWSKATFHRWRLRYKQQGLKGLETRRCKPLRVRRTSWSKQQEQQVQHLRIKFPLWGKRKLWKVLSRDHGFTLSISTVGRILKRLLKLCRIKPVSFYFGRVKPKRKRQFTHHAKRWQYGMKARQPGELIQVDHRSVELTDGFALKEFNYEQIEAYITTRRSFEIQAHKCPVAQQLTFDVNHLKKVHHHLFQDIFDWAGEFRSYNIRKNGDLFTVVEKLEKAIKVDNYLLGTSEAVFIDCMAQYADWLGLIHPFPEGNGRTQRLFLYLLAQHSGRSMDITNIQRWQNKEAAIQYHRSRNLEPLKILIKDAMS